MFPNDLFAAGQDLKKNKRIYTVSEITQDIKLVLESNFTEIWVEGEISNISRISTGTIFFNLKDSASLIKCVIFGSSVSSIKFDLKDGLRAICFGRIGVYEKDGKYQLYVRQVEPKGIGSLQLALEQLKQKLEKEGLFALGHKRPIPYLPAKIGIVTSPTGAAIKDILKVLNARFKDLQIILSPVRVQGEGAKDEIAAAIRDFSRFNQTLPDKEKIEVLIVGRGGGSIEDLWAFNEEVVARAIYDSEIPVISAVGHERDWSIADLTADLRAPTPSVAAEMVIPKKEDLKEKLGSLVGRLKRVFAERISLWYDDLDSLVDRLLLSVGHALELSASNFTSLAKKLAMLNPAVLIPRHQEKIVNLDKQIFISISHLFQIKQAEFNKACGDLANLNPLGILSRGYSVTFKFPEDKIIKDAKALKVGDSIKTRLHKGDVISKVIQVS